MPPFIEIPALFVWGFLVIYLLGRLVLPSPRRLDPALHWTERARRCWTARVFLSQGPVAISAGALGALYFGSSEHGLGRVFGDFFALAGGSFLGSLPCWRQLLGRPYPAKVFARDLAVGYLLRLPVVLIFLTMTLLLAFRRLDASSIAIMGGAIVLATACTLGAHLPLCRVLGLLAPPTDRVLSVVRAAAERAGIAPPQSFLLRWNWANALALPFARIVVFTPPLLDILDDEELTLVAAHEIGHLQETRRQKLTRLTGLPVALSLFSFPVWLNTYGGACAICVTAAGFAGARFLRIFVQRMERQADAAARQSGQDSPAYARALEKLYAFNQVPAVLPGKRHSHPQLYDRLIAAGFTPEYPRPVAPRRLPALLLVVLATILVVTPLVVVSEWQDKTIATTDADQPVDDNK